MLILLGFYNSHSICSHTYSNIFHLIDDDLLCGARWLTFKRAHAQPVSNHSDAAILQSINFRGLVSVSLARQHVATVHLRRTRIGIESGQRDGKILANAPKEHKAFW